MVRYLFCLVLFALWSLPAVVCAFEVPEQYANGITVVHDDDMAPLSFWGLNREPKGFVIDYWRKWSQETGVPVSFKLLGWKAGLDYVRTHSDAVHGGLFRTDERLDFFSFSDQIFLIETGVFVLKGEPITGIDDIVNTQVGVLEGGAALEVMKAKYPHIPLRIFPSVKGMIDAFAMGKIKALVMDRPTFVYMAGTMAAIKEAVFLDTVNAQYLRAGVAKGNEVLLDMVARGMRRVDADEREYILRRWFVTDGNSSRTLKIVVVLSLVGLAIALAMLFKSGRRSHQRAQKEEPPAL